MSENLLTGICPCHIGADGPRSIWIFVFSDRLDFGSKQYIPFITSTAYKPALQLIVLTINT